MTKEEAEKFKSDSSDIVGRMVRYNNEVWKASNLFVNKMESDFYIVRLSLTQPPSTEFEVPFDDPKNFPLVG